MPFGRIRASYHALPLWLKLTLLNTLVVSIIATAALIGVREGLRVMLKKELEVALLDETYEIDLNVAPQPRTTESIFEEMAKTSAGHLRHGWFLQLFDERGQHCEWASDNTPLDMFYTPIHTQVATSKTVQSEGYLLTRLRLHRPGLPDFWVRLGATTEFISEDVNNVTRIMGPVLGFILLLAPAGGYLLASRATAPLKKIIATTEQLRPNHLADRLPLRGTGDELDQLSEKINHFLDQIADHLGRNREFVANAAHELRSPLAAIESAIDVSLGSPRSLDEYQDLLATVQEECRQLSVLVNQLLLLAESDAGCLENARTEVALDTIAQMSLDMFSGVMEEKGQTLTAAIQQGVHVLADNSRLRQVVNNLLDNAIKYTSRGGHITVRLFLDQDQRQAVFAVSDTGVGIPSDCLPRIFDRFFQVDRSRYHETVQHGTGLGLSICYAIARAYGGDIRVESTLGRGSTFTVRLPGFLAAAPVPAAGSKPAVTAS